MVTIGIEVRQKAKRTCFSSKFFAICKSTSSLLLSSSNITVVYFSQRNDTVIKAETALLYDAVHLFAKALHDLDTSQQIDIQPLSCDGQDTWPHGYSLINYMKIVSNSTIESEESGTKFGIFLQVEMKGLTNLIKFDNQGFRTDFILDIIELSASGIRKVGDWNSTQGVNFTRSFGDQQQDIVDNLKNKTLIVTALLVCR